MGCPSWGRVNKRGDLSCQQVPSSPADCLGPGPWNWAQRCQQSSEQSDSSSRRLVLSRDRRQAAHRVFENVLKLSLLNVTKTRFPIKTQISSITWKIARSGSTSPAAAMGGWLEVTPPTTHALPGGPVSLRFAPLPVFPRLLHPARLALGDVFAGLTGALGAGRGARP